MSGPTVQQVARAATAGTSSAQPVFGSACTAGNTWIAISSGAVAAMASNPSTSNGGWTRLGGYSDPGGGSDQQTEVWMLTATATTTPPQIQSGSFNSDRNVVGIWEVTPATLDQLVAGGVAAAGGTTSNLTTGAANTLILIGEAARFEDPAITGGGWSIDFATGTADTIIGGHQAAASSGTTVNATIAASGFANTGYAMVSLANASTPSTETAAVTMALHGVSFSVGEARKESAAATLALRGISYTGHAVDERTAAVTLVLGQANFIINALDVTAITSLVHFYTF